MKRRWETQGGEPSMHNKGPISLKLRAVADVLLLAAQDRKCSLCGLELTYPGDISRDHCFPFSLSRDDSLWNTRLAHRACDQLRRRNPLTRTQRERFRQSGETLDRLVELLVKPRSLQKAEG